MTYEAVVTTLKNVENHPNADRLKIATACGYRVVVGLDAQEGQTVILFPEDGQLSTEYAEANNLVRNIDPETGVNKGGYFDINRRVRAQTLRGVKSEAFVMYPSSLDFISEGLGETINVGDTFSTLAGIPICNKYVNPATKRAGNKNVAMKKKGNESIQKMFHEHMDTSQFRLAPTSSLKGLVTVTHKLHGTSGRSGKFEYPEEPKRNFIQKIWDSITGNVPPKHSVLKSVYGTRRVIRGDIKNGHSERYRIDCHARIDPFIRKNEIWYYEIVGFEETGKPIMSPGSTEKLSKEQIKRFGKSITFSYGCRERECRIFVYRIAVVNSDGDLYDLPFGAVKQRAELAGLEHVPEDTTFILHTDHAVDYFRAYIANLMETSDIGEPLDQRHIREGFCVRVDSLTTGKVSFYKEKMFEFKVVEGIIKDSGVVDTEEAESSYDSEEELEDTVYSEENM